MIHSFQTIAFVFVNVDCSFNYHVLMVDSISHIFLELVNADHDDSKLHFPLFLDLEKTCSFFKFMPHKYLLLLISFLAFDSGQ